LAKNQMISRVLENILHCADEESLLKFCNAFTPALRVICADPFASHVLEKLLEVTSTVRADSADLSEWFQKTSKFILNNYTEFVFDKFANAVMRRVFHCLSGTVDQSLKNLNAKKGKKLLTTKEKPVVHKLKKENVEIFKDFYHQFLNWHQFNDLLAEVHTSSLVQVFMQCLQAIDGELAYQVAVQTLKAIDSKFDMGNLTTLFTLESCIQVTNDALYEFMYDKFFKGKLDQMAVHPKAQHTLRKLVTYCSTKETFEDIFDAIEGTFDEVLKLEHTNIIVACAETCKALNTRQAEFVKRIKSLLMKEGSEETSFVEVVAKLNKTFTPREDGTGTTFLLELNGCLLLQHMLEFHKPHKVVKGILELETRKAVKLALDPKGSHIIDSYFKSSTVGDKNKEKLLLKYKEDLVDFACSKFGSRVLDSMWAWGSIKQKGIIAASLSEKLAKVSANEFGKFQSERMALHSYKRDPKKWEEFQASSGKRKAEIEEFTAAISSMANEEAPVKEEEQETPKKKKKKKHHRTDQ